MLIILILLSSASEGQTQKPIVLHGQPNWKHDLDISLNVFEWEDLSSEPDNFTSVISQPFSPLEKTRDRYSKRPDIRQWIRFEIQNTHPSDSLDLFLNLGAHYLIQMFANGKLVSERGTSVATEGPDRFGLPLLVPPQEQIVYYVKVQERVRYLTPLTLKLGTAATNYKQLSTAFHQERWLRFLMPLMAGVLLLVAISGFYQFYLLKDRAVLYYSIYAVTALLFSLYWIEERFNLMWFNDEVKMVLDSFVYVPVLAGYTYFVGTLLNVKSFFRRLWLTLQLLLCLVGLQSLMAFAEYRTGTFFLNSNFYYSYLTGIPGLAVTIILLLSSIKSRSAVKSFVIAGLSSLILLLFVPLGLGFGNFYNVSYELASIIHFGPFFLNLGITIEAICFALGLAYRTKLISQENALLHNAYTSRLEEELAVRSKKLLQQTRIVEEQRIRQLQTEFAQKLAETEMTALRAQMNPHFIFNCLNSIKLYTLANDSKSASEYLTTFSHLIRLVLENSHSEKIILKKELETLRLYMELEAMRFKNKIRYEIIVQEDIDQQYIEIPPLLLQPYVENAIWHGLLHRKEGGRIRIHISQPSENQLQVVIADNGIGRVKAGEYKSKSAISRKSFGLKMTSERIDTLNNLYGTNTHVQINDIINSKGDVTGTEVTIMLTV